MPQFNDQDRYAALVPRIQNPMRSCRQPNRKQVDVHFMEFASAGVSKPTIALLTPYTGGNLGDGAIQDAVIQNIRSRFPDRHHLRDYARIRLIPLERHGIPSFPFAGFSVPDYSVAATARPNRTLDSSRQPPAQRNVLRRVAKLLASGADLRSPARCFPGAGRDHADANSPISSTAFDFLKELNFLVVSGGGQLDDLWGGPWGHPYALLKWTVLARLRGAGPIFLSVGFGRLDTRLSRSVCTRPHCRLAAYRSYRDSGSRDLMNAPGSAGTIQCFPTCLQSFVRRDLRHRDFAPHLVPGASSD